MYRFQVASLLARKIQLIIGKFRGPFYLIIEYAEHGSLKNYLRDLKTVIETKSEESEILNKEEEFQKTRNETYNFAFQISKGMEYLEGLKVGVAEREYFSVQIKTYFRLFTETWRPGIFFWLNLAKFAKFQILECLETCTWTRPTPR